MSITISSKRSGLTVTMSDEDYAVRLTKHGLSSREEILNTAGRVLSHRRTLDKIRTQVLTDEQRKQIESLAHAYAIEDVLNTQIIDMGYGSCLRRAQVGGMMPESSWDRIISRAREACGDEIKYAETTDAHRNFAMDQLGFYTDEDEKWSSRVADWCKWEITAPDGWGEHKTAEAA